MQNRITIFEDERKIIKKLIKMYKHENIVRNRNVIKLCDFVIGK